MPALIARLARSLPLVIALLVAAGVIYIVAAWRTSPNRAKLILIRAFMLICGAVIIFFLLAAGYAALEQNYVAVEIALTFALPGVIGLLITLIARHVFMRNHPQYEQAPVRAEYIQDRPLIRFLQWIIGR